MRTFFGREPRQVCRRLISVGYAAMSSASKAAQNLATSAGAKFPRESKRRRQSNRFTHSSVAFSAASKLRQGLRRWMTFRLAEAVDRLGQGVALTVPHTADSRFYPGHGCPACRPVLREVFALVVQVVGRLAIATDLAPDRPPRLETRRRGFYKSRGTRACSRGDSDVRRSRAGNRSSQPRSQLVRTGHDENRATH